MTALSLNLILLHGLILSAGLGVILIVAMRLNPRLMLSDYPPEVRARVPPLTSAEKRQQALLGIAFYGFFLGVLLYSNAQLAARSSEPAFFAMLVNTYVIFVLVNLFDLLVVDYLVLMVLKPRSLFIREAEDDINAQSFEHHWKGFLKGLAYGLVFSLIVTAICALLEAIQAF